MPGIVNSPGTDPLVGGIGGDTAADLPGLTLGSPYYRIYPLHFCGQCSCVGAIV